MSACRSCGAAILWCRTVATESKPSKSIPIDALEVDGEPRSYGAAGNMMLTGERDIITGAPMVAVVNGGPLLSHFATCPQAKNWRRK